MIIDAHCHVWPDHIARQVLAQRPVGLSPVYDGTLDGLRRQMDQAGIDLAVCLGVAAEARTLRRTNEFIGAIDRRRFVPFGTVHPQLSPEENLASLRENQIVGVKLHPLFQELSFADPRVIDILQALAEARMPVIAHVGEGGDDVANQRGTPASLRAALDDVPDLVLIAGHFGGYHRLDDAEQFIVGSRAILETSWPPTVGELDASRLLHMIRRHGADRVVFGSDWPMSEPAKEISAIRRLGLSDAEQDAILGMNIARVLGLDMTDEA